MTETAANKNDSHSFEQKLWGAADKLRKNIDAAEYKHIVLGLIFFKYISDVFDVLHQKLLLGEGGSIKVPILWIGMSIQQKMCFLFQLKQGSHIFRDEQSNPILVKLLIWRWKR